MLLCEQGGWNQHGDLSPGLHGSEARPQRHLGFAEANVTAHEAVHWLTRAQISEDIVDRVGLVVGQFEREPGFEAMVLGVGPAEAVAGPAGSPRVYLQQFSRNVANPLRGLAFRACPLVCTEPMERCIFGWAARVSGNQVKGPDRYVQQVPASVFDRDELCRHVVDVETR